MTARHNILILAFLLILVGCKKETDDTYKASIDSLKNELSGLKAQLADKEKNTPVKKTLHELYNASKDAVFLLVSENDEGAAQGSGFFVSETGCAVSNYHMFDGASKAIVLTESGERYMITEMLTYDQDKDYVIFRVGDGTTKFPYLKVAPSFPEIGDACYAIGNPRGLTKTLSTGVISSYREDNLLLQTTAPITHGSSGGPLFNSNGEVLGITSGGMGEADLNFAVNIQMVPVLEYAAKLPDSMKHLPTPVDSIKDRVQRYVAAAAKYDRATLESFYAPQLDRFYSEFNVQRDEAISILGRDRKRSKITSVKGGIDWNSFEAERNFKDEYIVNFLMNYTIERQEKNKPTNFELAMTMKLDPKFLITSIYENILYQE